MLFFGNILQKPVKEIWDDTGRKFCIPGWVCYANKSSPVMAATKQTTWPLGARDAEEILELCVPCDKQRLPEFYRRMGMRLHACMP